MKTEEPGQNRHRGEETQADDEGKHHRGDELAGSSQCRARRLPGVLGLVVLERIDGFVGLGRPLGSGLPDAQAGLLSGALEYWNLRSDPRFNELFPHRHRPSGAAFCSC